MSHNEELVINDGLVSHSVGDQFPQWKDLSFRPVALSGAANLTNSNAVEAMQALSIIGEVLSDHRNNR